MLRSPQKKKGKRKIDDGKIIWGEISVLRKKYTCKIIK